MTRRVLRSGAATLALGVALTGLVACTAEDDLGYVDKGVPPGSYRLVSFDSCDEALSGLRTALSATVATLGAYGGFATRAEGAAGAPAPAPAMADSAKGPAGPTPAYSGTNTHEAGVDEPDLVKTDGRRIVVVAGGVLRVVDAATRTVIGTVDLGTSTGEKDRYRFEASNLLLSGDRALVLANGGYGFPGGPMIDLPAPAGAERGAIDLVDPAPKPTGPTDQAIYGPELILVDLTGPPRVLSRLRVDGGLVDARQVGSMARVVIRSNPRITFPYLENASPAKQLATNQDIIEQAGIDAWLPRIEVTTGTSKTTTEIGCDAVSRPATYTGASLLTVLSFDLVAPNLDRSQPITLVADGDVVYSNGPSLYVSSDQSWRRGIAADGKPLEATTEIYRFETSGTARPRFVAGGKVPGYLINQYAMSEWDGYLRVATTTGEAPRTQSGIHILATTGGTLAEVGRVDGLGKGERIYAVRFIGPTGYVVTFRQTDPLYTVDLSQPRAPKVRGALKIPGYSAYLHPGEGSTLIGIGQNATNEGRVTGTQVSLFDVADLTDPARIATYTIEGGSSQAEVDPHAFLYWPAERLLVVPLQRWEAVGGPATPVDPGNGSGGGTSGSNGSAAAPGSKLEVTPTIGALLLRVDGTTITRLGFLSQPADLNGYAPAIERSLIIGSTLWTVSRQGLLATDIHSQKHLTWLAF